MLQEKYDCLRQHDLMFYLDLILEDETCKQNVKYLTMTFYLFITLD